MFNRLHGALGEKKHGGHKKGSSLELQAVIRWKSRWSPMLSLLRQWIILSFKYGHFPWQRVKWPKGPKGQLMIGCSLKWHGHSYLFLHRSQLMYIFMQQVNAKDATSGYCSERKPGDLLSNRLSFLNAIDMWVCLKLGLTPQMAIENQPSNLGVTLFSDKPMWEELLCSLDIPKNSRSNVFDRLASAGQFYRLQVFKPHKPHFRQKRCKKPMSPASPEKLRSVKLLLKKLDTAGRNEFCWSHGQICDGDSFQRFFRRQGGWKERVKIGSNFIGSLDSAWFIFSW